MRQLELGALPDDDLLDILEDCLQDLRSDRRSILASLSARGTS